MRKPKNASIATTKKAVKKDALATAAAVTMTANEKELATKLDAFGKDLTREHDGYVLAEGNMKERAIAAGRIAIAAKNAIIAVRGKRPKKGGFEEWVETLKLQGRGNGLRSVQTYMQLANAEDSGQLIDDKAQHAAPNTLRGLLRGLRKPPNAEERAKREAAADAKAKAKATEAVTGIQKTADALQWITSVADGMKLLAENPTGLTTLLVPANREKIQQALDRLLSSTSEIARTVDVFYSPRQTPVQEVYVVSQPILSISGDMSSYPASKAS